MKSSLKNMLLSLTGITILAGTILAIVNISTEKPIAEGAERTRNEAIAAILPPFDKIERSTATDSDGDTLTIYIATLEGSNTGVAVETFSNDGFGGYISIIAGFDKDGSVCGYRILQHAETPGLGANMDKWFMADGTPHNIIGSNGPLAVKADGGDIDAITGATITSRAFLQAINRARSAATNIR